MTLFKSLRNCVLYVLTCQRTYLLTYLAYLSAHVLMVLAWFCVHEAKYLARSSSHVPYVLGCLHANIPYMLTCSRAIVPWGPPNVPFVLMCSCTDVCCVCCMLTYGMYLQFFFHWICSFVPSCIRIRKTYGIKWKLFLIS